MECDFFLLISEGQTICATVNAMLLCVMTDLYTY